MNKRPFLRILRALSILSCAFLLQSCCLFSVRPPVYEPVTLANGLVLQDLVVPEIGAPIRNGDLVTIDYVMDLEDGTRVDSTLKNGRPIRFEVAGGQVPAGLDMGILGMKLFGSRRMILPPELGYGEVGRPPRIPPDATLTLEVEVMKLEAANAGIDGLD